MVICPQCGYPVDDLSCCPECGLECADFYSHRDRRHARASIWLMRVGGLALLIVGGIVAILWPLTRGTELFFIALALLALLTFVAGWKTRRLL